MSCVRACRKPCVPWVPPIPGRSPFKWRFPDHFYLYLAIRELEAERRAVDGNDGPMCLMLPASVHELYEAYCDIRLAPPDISLADEHEQDGEQGGASPESGAAGSPYQSVYIYYMFIL